MMHMTFYWGHQVTILFDSWKTNSWLSYLLSLLALFLLAVFYQFNEQNRVLLKPSNSSPKNPSSATTPLLGSKVSLWSLSRFGGAILFGVNSAIGYLLMLAIMSFNGGVLIAVVLGLAVGYFFFRSDDGGVVVDNSCGCA